jgi:hypothetical protein
MLETSLPAEKLVASQEGLCSMELTYDVHNLTFILDIYLIAYLKQIKNNTYRRMLGIYIVGHVQIL